jgi:hypothetical protein
MTADDNSNDTSQWMEHVSVYDFVFTSKSFVQQPDDGPKM